MSGRKPRAQAWRRRLQEIADSPYGPPQVKVDIREALLEIDRINGPFTCNHDPRFVGGACAACHAEALEKIRNLELDRPVRRESCGGT